MFTHLDSDINSDSPFAKLINYCSRIIAVSFKPVGTGNYRMYTVYCKLHFHFLSNCNEILTNAIKIAPPSWNKLLKEARAR